MFGTDVFEEVVVDVVGTFGQLQILDEQFTVVLAVEPIKFQLAKKNARLQRIERRRQLLGKLPKPFQILVVDITIDVPVFIGARLQPR